LFTSTSHCSHQLLFVPNPTLHKPTQSSKLWHQILFLQLGNLTIEIVPCKKDQKIVLKINKFENHLVGMLCSEKMAMEDGCYFIFFIFWETTKLVKFTLKNRRIQKFLNFFVKKWQNFAKEKNTRWSPQELGR
jgi:hypothetical protein